MSGAKLGTISAALVTLCLTSCRPGAIVGPDDGTTPVDLVAPWVTDVSPANGAGGVALNALIIVQFSAAMDRPSTEAAIGISTNLRTTAFQWRDDSTVEVSHLPFLSGTAYTITVGETAKSSEGALLQRRADNPNPTTFSTKDAVRPQVKLIQPANGALDVGLNQRIDIVFDEAMDQQSVNGAISLTPTVTGLDLQWTSPAVLSIGHDNFPIDTAHTLTIAATALDRSSNALTTFSSSFTSGSTLLSEGEIAFRSAYAQYLGNDFAGAKLGFAAIVSTYPTEAVAGNAQYYLGRIAHKTKDFVGARTAYVLVIGRGEDHKKKDDAQYQIGRTYYDEKLYEQAIAAFRVVVTTYSESESVDGAQYFIGRSFHKQKDYPQARLEYQLVITNYGGDPTAAKVDDAHYQIGMTYYDAKTYSEAISSFAATIATYPASDSADGAQYFIGRSYHRLGDLGQARIAYQEVVDNYTYPLAAKMDDAQYQIGATYYQEAKSDAGLYAAAMVAFRLVITAYPDSDSADGAQYFIGRSYHQQLNLTAARLAYQKVIDNYIYPRAAKVDDAQFQLGLTYYKDPVPNYTLAAAAFEKVVLFYADSDSAGSAQFRLGRANEKLGLIAKARTAYRATVANFIDSPRADDAQYQIGETYYAQKDYITAQAEYQKVVDHPTLSRGNLADDALYRVGRCLTKQNLFEDARTAYAKLFVAYPGSKILPDAQYRIAMTFHEQNNFAQEEAALLTLKDAYADSARITDAELHLAGLQPPLDIAHGGTGSGSDG